MPDAPAATPVGPGAPPPPQPAVEVPASLSDTIQEVVGEMESQAAEKETDDAVQVGEAAEVDVGEQAGGGEEVGGEGEDEGGEVQGEEERAEEVEGEGETEVEAGAEEEVETFTVKLPGRRDGDEGIELDLEGLDPDAKEGFRRLMNEGLRRDQLDQAMEQVRGVQAEVQDVMISMEADPINFIMERTTPELRIDLARHILSEAAAYDAVVPDLAQWDRSPEAREAGMAKLERDRVLAQRDAEGVLAQKARSRANAREIHDHVRSMVPEGTSEDVQELFVDQAMRVIQQYATQQQMLTLDVNQIEPILSQTKVLHLLKVQGEVGPPNNPTDPSSPVPARSAATGTSLREAEETAERFRKTSARKRNAAAVAPPGAGPAPVQPPQPPEEVQRSVKESIKWYRKNVLRR